MATAKSNVTALKNEAKPLEEREPVSFEYDGETYTIDPANVDNLELFEAVEDEKYLTAARGFVGKDQWNKFKDTHRDAEGRVPMAPVEGFLQALMEAVGQGN